MLNQTKEEGGNAEDLLSKLLDEIKENPPWTTDQENCWNEFISDLENKPDSQFKTQILSRAKSKLYHDFESEHATPKYLLVQDLDKIGFNGMKKKAMNGDYDF